MNDKTDLTIIIPVYNTKEYLCECFDSVIRATEDLNYEVIMVDDESGDGSDEIAKSYEKKYRQFHYHRIPHGGLGNARNYGVKQATGTYIYFMDSDDMLVPGILKKMYTVAVRNKTDLTVCCALRIRDGKIKQTGTRAFSAGQGCRDHITHITKEPVLAFNSAIWTKLISRSFYLEHHICFENTKYEDVLPSLKMYYYANAVSVLYSRGYIWRIRTGNNESITQDATTAALKEKLNEFKKALAFSDEINNKNIREFVELKALSNNFDTFLQELHNMSRNTQEEQIAIIASFIRDNIKTDSYEKLNLINKQIVQDILNGDAEHLQRVINYKKANYKNAPIIQKGEKPEMMLPDDLFTIKDRLVENDFISMPPNMAVRWITVKDKVIMLKGYLYYPRINADHQNAQKMQAYLYNEATGYRTKLKTTNIESHYLTEKYGNVVNNDDYKNYMYNYDWAGFKIRIHLDKVKLNKHRGDNLILMDYSTPAADGFCVLRGIQKEYAPATETYDIETNDDIVKLYYQNEGTVSLNVSKKISFIDRIKKKYRKVLKKHVGK